MADIITTAAKQDDTSILLVLHTPMRRQGNKFFLEPSTCNGLERWAENFSKVCLACPVIPEDESHIGHVRWLDVDGLAHRNRIEIVPLPRAYKIGKFLRTYRPTRQLLAEKIRDNRYLQFCIGGLVGDWASVGAYKAHKQGRKFAVWTDRVEHEVVRQTSNNSLKHKIRNFIQLPIMKYMELDVVKKSAVGLFHGNETFRVYSPCNPNSYLVHNIHIKPSHLISEEALAAKVSRIKSAAPLKISYSGRLDSMKAPLDWLAVLKKLDDDNIDFNAIWMGGGPLREEVEAKIRQDGLQNKVSLPGVKDHNDALATIQDSDIFLFTHITPESPRCVIEALVCGAPIVGYASPYCADLIAKHGGGKMTDIGDVQKLANVVKQLNANREELANLVDKAALDGRPFNDAEIFRYRSDLIKRHLP